ncbi:MAG TPA: DUF1799 domain-containing protein [Thauera aminoaromatica]|nr:DUF1799 domain-containing protein [Thauera aminoaromatica]
MAAGAFVNGEKTDAQRSRQPPEDPPDPRDPRAVNRAAGLARLAAVVPPPEAVEEFRLWSEHLPAFRLFEAVQTQLRWSDNRPTGLDWVGVRAHPACWALPEDQRERVLGDVAVIEHPWLAERNRRITEALNQARQR